MEELDGRVVVVTGAGRGLGREHALLFAGHGARVVVNDVGGPATGPGADEQTADTVVQEIKELGGEAVANTDSVSDWQGSQRLIRTAVETFGGLDVLVNNAGILRDRMLVNMEESDWDAVLDVHLKGTFCPTRHAAAYWRQRAKEVGPQSAAVVCTSSGSGLQNSVGQANYGSAKAGIAAFAQIAAKELARYGVRVNTIAPVARTRMTLQTPGTEAMVRAPGDGRFDAFDPGNIAPLVVALAHPACQITGGVWHVWGGQVGLFEGWHLAELTDRRGTWPVEELLEALPRLAQRGAAEDRLLSERTTIADVFNVMGVGGAHGAR